MELQEDEETARHMKEEFGRLEQLELQAQERSAFERKANQAYVRKQISDKSSRRAKETQDKFLESKHMARTESKYQDVLQKQGGQVKSGYGLKSLVQKEFFT